MRLTGIAVRTFYSSFFSPAEAGRLIRLGIPVYIAQMSNMGMAFVDTAMTGQASAEDMAAVALAGSLWAPVSLFGVGVLLALTPLSAQLVGQGRSDRTPHMLRQGIWCSALLAVPLMIFFQIISNFLGSFGLEPRLAALAGGYLRAMVWGLPGLFLFVNVRCFLEGYSRTRPAMIIGILGLLLNVPVNYVLIYGKLGLPEMGAVGCGVATALCFWFMALSMVFYVRRGVVAYKLGALFKPLWCALPEETRVDWPTIRRIFRIGLPSALAMLFEVSLFAVSAILLAPLGTITIAGHQVAMNFSGLLFMLPLSMGITSTIRVGYCLGAGQWTHARLAAWTAMTLGVSFALVNSLGTVFFREYIVLVYNSDPAVVALASHLLLYAAAFQLLDTVQAVGIGILRGYNDTRIISIVCFVAYWIIGLPLGYTLARTDLLGPAWGATGFWLSYLVVLGIGAVCYTWRVVYLHGQDGESLRKRIRR